MIQQPLTSSSAAVALPALVVANNKHLQQQQQQQQDQLNQQHSPQVYQQATIVKQQQQQNYLPANGLSPAHLHSQGNSFAHMLPNIVDLHSPSSSANTSNQPQRPQIYAPKPTYFTQQQQQNLSNYSSRQQLSTQQSFYNQQIADLQHSPPQLSVRQVSQQPNGMLNGVMASNQHLHVSDLSLHALQAEHMQPTMLLPQHQGISYHNASLQVPQATKSILSHSQFHQHMPISHLDTPSISQFNNNINRQHFIQQHQQLVVDSSRWSQIERQHMPQTNSNGNYNRSSRHSDRADSVSTADMSKFNDQRSIAMRSQFTSRIESHQFKGTSNVLKLIGVAMKRLIGFEQNNDFSEHQIANSTNNNKDDNQAPQVAGQNQTIVQNNVKQYPNGGHHNHHDINSKITGVDCGQSYHFNKSVFQYQLLISRIFVLLCAFVIISSPLVMLVLPKLEFMFSTGVGDVNLQHNLNDQPVIPNNNNNNNLVTHAVGFSNLNRQQQLQQSHLSSNQYYLPQPQWRISECSFECDSQFIGFAARYLMLLIAYWAIFLRSQTASLARLDLDKCLLITFAFTLSICYWLFFLFRVFDKRFNDYELSYATIVIFANSMLESLLVLHYLALVLLEFRQKKKIYCLKVVRSPDGSSQYFSCGSMSIQNCALLVVEKYQRKFKALDGYSNLVTELEDQCARNLTKKLRSDKRGEEAERRNDNSTSRSRPTSPTVSTRNSTVGTSRSGRSASRCSRALHRSSSRSSDREQRTVNNNDDNNEENSSKKVQTTQDSKQKVQLSSNGTQDNSCEVNNGKSSSSQDSNQQQDNLGTNVANGNESSNSAGQSSDTTGLLLESSLETIRAASTNDLIANKTNNKSSINESTINLDNKKQVDSLIEQNLTVKNINRETKSGRDDLESVRSARSRRSTSHRSHHRHHHHSSHGHSHHSHKSDRSSSRQANNNENYDTRSHRSYKHSSRSYQHFNDYHNDNNNDRRGHQTITSSAFDSVDENERKLLRRRCRLLVDVEEAFSRMKESHEDSSKAIGNQLQLGNHNSTIQQITNSNHQDSSKIGAAQAARYIYPSIARSLQKYLRFTKQTTRHNLQSIHEHLTKCLVYNLSPRVFIEKFTNSNPVLQQHETKLFSACKTSASVSQTNNGMISRHSSDEFLLNSWSVISDSLVSKQIGIGTFFLLKQGDISLLVSVGPMPRVDLKEEVLDSNQSKFVMQDSNSETSV